MVVSKRQRQKVPILPKQGSDASANSDTNNPLNKEVVLITGAESGIGRDLAVGLAQAGAKVLVNYLESASQAAITLSMIRDAGGEGLSVPGDVRKPVTAEKLVNAAITNFGRLDAVVNNAGIHIYKYLQHVTEEDWDKQLNTNAKGPFFITKAAVHYWRSKQVSGSVVNITSCGATLPFPRSAAYNASKGALLMLTRQLALELAPEGIRVNAVAPGVIHTSMNDALLREPRFRRAWRDQIPLRRIGAPGDVVGAVVFLCSSSSQYITGAQIVVDGGWMLKPAWPVA